MNRLLQTILLLNIFSLCADAQPAILHGKIYDRITDSVLAGITVFNRANKSFSVSAKDGSYSIAAGEGDKIMFTASGFKTDSVIVTFGHLLTQYDVSLSVRYVSLGGITLNSSYRADSLERRNIYRYYFDSLKNITGGNRPTDGVGISISPLSYFSSKAKQQRELKKRLLKEERESYIDRAFPAEWVERLTNLHGDSLRLFMYRFRPSYNFCRKTERADMIVYISDKLKEFRKPKP